MMMNPPRLSGRSEAVSEALSLWSALGPLPPPMPPMPPPPRAARLAKPLVSTRFSRAWLKRDSCKE